jgi:uncharacterized protein (DUF58 family)
MKNSYLTNRFFYGIAALAVLFVVPWCLPLVQMLLLVAIALTIVDAILVFQKKNLFSTTRQLPKVFSLSDNNPVTLILKNNSPQTWFLTLIEELPIQFQRRDFEEKLTLEAQVQKKVTYQLRPLQRGEYEFGQLLAYVSSPIGLVERRIVLVEAQKIAVYPSIIQMKSLGLKAMSNIAHDQGIKKMRRLGHSYEFDQIKNYVRGDDYRSINWKASGRHNALMVNQYEDERAQQIYCILDKSRVMRMPFNGLSLLDYAINATLALSNIALQKEDKAGLISFSDKIGTTLKADRQGIQLHKILNALYNESERQTEASYELLFHAVQKIIRGRSLVLLFTNFESDYALERVLPILRKINASHLLVVVFFENTEIRAFSQTSVTTLHDIYDQTIAQKFLADKQSISQSLRQYGIQSILTKPEDLSINTINKYLELKAKGVI